MKDHLEWHAGITYPCNLCDKVFKCVFVQIRFGICGFVTILFIIYRKRHALSNHLTKHKHDKKKRNFKCQQCDKAYFTKDVLRQHE